MIIRLSELKFPVAINKINEFEKNNNIFVNVLSVEEKKIHIYGKSKYDNRKNVVNLLLIADGERRHYTAFQRLTRLLGGSNSRVIVSMDISSIFI